MGRYFVELSDSAKEDLRKIHTSGNKALIKKIEKLFIELQEHPRLGTGHPEQLRFLNGIWSRRLDKKNRIRYEIDDDIVTVLVLSAMGHYNDK